LVIAGLVLTWQFVQPAPPRTISIATGSSDGAYYRYAERYRAILARNGIELCVIETSGSVENLRRLRSETEPVDLAFVQGGVATDEQREQLSGLGSLFYEPLWLIGPEGGSPVPLNELNGSRIGVGPESSGTHFLALHLLHANGIGPDDATLVSEDLAESIGRLVNGTLDLVFMVAAPDSPALKRLAEDGRGRLLNLPRTAAYARRNHALTDLTLPTGTLSPARNVPDRDLSLIAATANLVATPSLHPALVDLLISAADKVHGGGSLLAEPGTFPSPRNSDFPLNPDAERHYKHGPPFLQRYLPFWAASWVDRLKVMLLPLIGLMLPLVKLLPPIYRWRIRRHIFPWYLKLRRIDLEIETTDLTPQLIDELHDHIDRIESDAALADLPVSYTDQLYHLRLHIQLLRSKLEELSRIKSAG
jgi:TRAP transporter TAXI family solute receptor